MRTRKGRRQGTEPQRTAKFKVSLRDVWAGWLPREDLPNRRKRRALGGGGEAHGGQMPVESKRTWFSSVQSLSRVQLFATPWTAAHQASLSITNSQSPPRPMCIESVMPSNHLILCPPLLLLPSVFSSIRVFSSESALRHQVGQSIGVSASISVLPMNTQD